MKSVHTQPLSLNLKLSWDYIGVEYSQMPPGASDVVSTKQLVSVAFAPQEQTTWRVDGGSSRTTPLPPGSVFLYSSREFVWSRWNQPTECVHMTLDPNLISRVAQDFNKRSQESVVTASFIFFKLWKTPR